MSHRRQAALLVVPLVLTACGLTNAPEATPIPTPDAAIAPPRELERFYAQDIRWTNCGPADCGRLLVPVDYSAPDGATLELGITRVAATGERLGSLLVNPGGPGGSAVEYAKSAQYLFGDPVLESFDIIGLDPRGVATSSPVECLSDTQLDALASIDGTPDSPGEVDALIEAAKAPGEGCARLSPDLLAHVGTVDSARDLDIARAALGDESLTYLGLSYGTMLGATYAELFPDRVGRMVLDGALPPRLDLVEVTRGQAIGFENALRDFVSDCLGHDDCPLTGDTTTAVQQLRDWFTRLDANPLPAGARDLNEALASYAVLTNLYAPEYDYPRLRKALTDAMRRDDPDALLALLDSRISRDEDGRYTDNSTEAFYAITCLDRPYEGTVEDVTVLASQFEAEAPTFGPSLAWGLLTCADWPADADRITTTRAAGAGPILVVSATRDPATPHVWGEQLAEDLEEGRLLTSLLPGHTSYGNGSDCIDSAIERYLVAGVLPPVGTVCS